MAKIRSPWKTGYTIPEYVEAEPAGRGTFTTAWLPRRTISQVVPDYLAKPAKKNLYGRRTYGLGDEEKYYLVPTGQEDAAMPSKESGIPSWVLPAAIVAGAVFLLRK